MFNSLVGNMTLGNVNDGKKSRYHKCENNELWSRAYKFQRFYFKPSKISKEQGFYHLDTFSTT